jgi:L-threonylcarbamoyladenylate synthase
VETSDKRSANGRAGTAGADDPRLIRIPDDREAWEGLIEVGQRVLDASDLVVLPTDTVYGVGCNPFDPTAVDHVFAAKGRGRDLPLPVLVHDWRQAVGLVDRIDDRARSLIAEFWPGPLTLVLEEAAGIGWDLGRSRGTVAVRMPRQPFTLALIKQVGPIAVTSANRSGRPTPPTVREVMAQLDRHVGVYFDVGPLPDPTGRSGRQGAEGPLPEPGTPSTIVDLTGPGVRVLRVGAVDPAEVRRVLDLPADDEAG